MHSVTGSQDFRPIHYNITQIAVEIGSVNIFLSDYKVAIKCHNAL